MDGKLKISVEQIAFSVARSRITHQHRTSCPMTLQAGDQVLESRILHLPMAFDDRWTRECISRYMRSARQEAPYLPSNIDFVAKNNGTLHLALPGSVSEGLCASLWLLGEI